MIIPSQLLQLNLLRQNREIDWVGRERSKPTLIITNISLSYGKQSQDPTSSKLNKPGCCLPTASRVPTSYVIERARCTCRRKRGISCDNRVSGCTRRWNELSERCAITSASTSLRISGWNVLNEYFGFLSSRMQVSRDSWQLLSPDAVMMTVLVSRQ